VPFSDLTGGGTGNGSGIGGRGRIRIGGIVSLVEATGDIAWISVDSGDTTPPTSTITVPPRIGDVGGALMEVGYKGGGGLYTKKCRLRRLLGSDSVKASEQRRKLGRGIGGWRVLGEGDLWTGG